MVFFYYRNALIIASTTAVLVVICFTSYIPRSAWYGENDLKALLEDYNNTRSAHGRMESHTVHGPGHRAAPNYTASLSTKRPKPPSLKAARLLKQIQKGRIPRLRDFKLTDEEVVTVANLFSIRGLDSSVSLQRNFLECPAMNIIRHGSIHEFVDGRFVLTKQYQTCKNLSFERQRGMVGLISFPGSGNSWVRQLLETSTGVFTGSVYCDPSYIQAGMIGEGIHSNFVAAVKCHGCGSKVVKNFSKIIYIVRNPFDTFFADFNRKHAHKTDTQSKHVA